jgi:phospholipid transport system substrate-binding protein
VILRRSLLPAAIALLIGGAASVRPAMAAPDPAEMINDLGNRALEVLGKNATARQREARFRELFHEDFDVPAIARFVLGRYWRIATPEQQQEFVSLFAEYVTLSYGNRLAQYSGETLKVTGSRPEPGDWIVSSLILRPNGSPPSKVDWRLAWSGGSYKITDVIFEGISMAVTQRSEFASVIRRHGGQVQGLLTLLRQKTEGAAFRP